ncbi:hypothetical protein V3481_016551 [Fusarium oxysporum f. sp. vasinfectum]|uniref:C2H2-type domain-containing protein n=1 Tax=Fusarium oxysporum f. sp. vasinfectum 25433 TaxID=1089449 RepID=X0MJL8_FUSOX|nr:hypothetical protein FOTG_11411 [Fusarium oxysporum f. sp. vasinfectum 25433]
MSSSIPPAADVAPRTRPEKSQQTTDAKPRSLRERLKHKGRHYLNKAPGLLPSYAKARPSSRLMSNTLKEKMAVLWKDGDSSPTTDNDLDTPRDNSSTDSNIQNVVQVVPTGLQQHPADQTVSFSATTDRTDGEGPAAKSESHRRWIKAYPGVRRKRVTSTPILPLHLGELTGVGSQYDVANRPASALILGPYNADLKEKDDIIRRRSLSQPVTSTCDTDTDIPEYGQNFSFATYNPSELDLLRRLSEDTFQASTSARDSTFSFTRPSSIISAASTYDSSIGRASSTPSRRRSLFRKTLSSSSSLNIYRESLRNHRDHDKTPVPPIPYLDPQTKERLSASANIPVYQHLIAASEPTDSIASLVSAKDSSLTVSDQVALAGWVAQQRRLNKGLLLSSSFNTPKVQWQLASGQLQVEENPNEELSTIEERPSDAGPPSESMRRLSMDDHVDRGHLSTPRSHPAKAMIPSTGTRTETTLDARSTALSSKDDTEHGLTPGTSVTETDTSETDESMSDVSRQTDESFEEAFLASSLDPALLASVTALKDTVTALVVQRVVDWVKTCSPGLNQNSGASDSTQSSGQNGPPAESDANSKKRGIDDRESEGDNINAGGRGNGDDHEKRRKTQSAPPGSVPNLACPFVKEYPGERWPRCQKGWPSVHRIKEHIYRSHKAPMYCKRCFRIFKTEKELDAHLRQDPACEVVSPSREMPGIDNETKERLKSRRGIQNISEEEKWKHMYKVLFPRTEDIPSPYCDLQILEAPMTAETRAQYRSFLRQEVPARVIRDINANVRSMPGFQFSSEVSERSLFEMVSSAVWNAFDEVLPSLLPPTEHRDLPTSAAPVTEVLADSQDQILSVTSLAFQDEPDFLSSHRELPIVETEAAQDFHDTSTEDPIASLELLDPGNVAVRNLDFDELGEFGNNLNPVVYDFNFNLLPY